MPGSNDVVSGIVSGAGLSGEIAQSGNPVAWLKTIRAVTRRQGESPARRGESTYAERGVSRSRTPRSISRRTVYAPMTLVSEAAIEDGVGRDRDVRRRAHDPVVLELGLAVARERHLGALDALLLQDLRHLPVANLPHRSPIPPFVV